MAEEQSSSPTDGATTPRTLGEPAAATPEAHPPALTNLGSWLRLLLVGIGGLALDLSSKYWAFYELEQTPRAIVIVPNVLEFRTTFNTGALFGIGQGQTTLFLVASGFALLLVAWMFIKSSPRRWLLQIALGAIIGGALGNMYDRVNVRLYEFAAPGGGPRFWQLVELDDVGAEFRSYPIDGSNSRTLLIDRAQFDTLGGPVGCVRDFIKIPTEFFGREAWPWVFNIADMLLVGGISVLAVYLWRDGAPADEKKPRAPSPAPVSAGD